LARKISDIIVSVEEKAKFRGEGAYEKASELVDKHLAEHQVLPLGDEATETLARIVADAGL